MPAREKLELALFAAAGLSVGALLWTVTAEGPAGLAGAPLAVHVVGKLALLGAAVALSLANAGALGRGTAIGRAWLLLGLGVGALLAGELGEAVYQLVLGVLNPFPSVLDAFYLSEYPLLIAGLLGFLRAYGQAGYPMGSPRTNALLGGGMVLLGVALVWPLLAPVAQRSAPLLERLVAAAYPLLDVALLAAVILLLRGTRQFGGGRAWMVWALLLAGLAAIIAGDLRFAFFTAAGQEHVDPWSELLFVAAYLLVARGALKQRELVEA